jgi:hypothetical protein
VLHDIDRRFSLYREDSELSRLAARRDRRRPAQPGCPGSGRLRRPRPHLGAPSTPAAIGLTARRSERLRQGLGGRGGGQILDDAGAGTTSSGPAATSRPGRACPGAVAGRDPPPCRPGDRRRRPRRAERRRGDLRAVRARAHIRDPRRGGPDDLVSSSVVGPSLLGRRLRHGRVHDGPRGPRSGPRPPGPRRPRRHAR